jgi:hypothetical protein
MEEYKNKYLWLMPPYFLMIGILYLWAYWSSFRINIFEYAGLTDLVKVAIIPVGTLFFFVLIGFILGEYTYGSRLPDGAGRNTWIGKFLNKTASFWVVVYWVFLIYLILSDEPRKWNALPFIGMAYPYLVLKKSSFLAEIKSDSTRTTIVLAICILPIYAFCQGKLDSIDILNNEKYKYIDSIGEVKRAKYIGHVSQHMFFISQDNQKVVVQKIDKTPIVLINSFESDKKPNKPIKSDA